MKIKLYNRKGSKLPHIILGELSDGRLVCSPVVIVDNNRDLSLYKEPVKRKKKALSNTEEYKLAEWYNNERLKLNLITPLTNDFDSDAKMISWAMKKFNIDLDCIKNILEYVLSDEFWSDKVRSLSTISKKSKSNKRTKFENIIISMEVNKNNSNKKESNLGEIL